MNISENREWYTIRVLRKPSSSFHGLVFGFVILSSTAMDILQIDKHEDVFAITGKTNSELHLLGISKQMRTAPRHNLTEMLKINQYFYMGMTNKTLVVVADDYVPYVITRMHYGQMEVTGYMGELWLILQSVLQFRTVMKRATFEEGRRMLRSGEADVLLQPTVVTGNNIGVYDFTRPVAYSWYELYVRVPECEGSPDSYFTVWGLYLWISTLAIIIILIVSIRLMCNYGSFEENQSDANQTKECQNMEGSHVTLGICLLAVLGSLGSEGFQLRPCSTSGRVLMVTTLLFSLLLFNSYSAVLVASLAVTNTPLPFSDLDDVARKGTHALCVRNVSYAYMRLKEKEEDLEVASRWRRVVYRQPCGEVTESRDLERVLCGWDVAVLETPSNMAVATQNSSKSCHMKQIRGKFFAVPVSLEFRARFPYTDQINNYIHRLHTSGILHYLRKKWTTHSPLVSEEESVPNTTVTLQHVQLILVLYATCILCSTFILVLEIAWHNKNLQERRFVH